MPRQRRPENSKDKEQNDSSSNGSKTKEKAPKQKQKGPLYYFFRRAVTVVGSICLVISAGVGYKGYLETRVNTQFDDRKMVMRTGLDIPERFWGTYRPGTYFGLKTRDPNSLVTGLMWYFPKRLRPGGDGIRHWCEQSDNLEKYGWTHHDGTNFGIQEIHDGPFQLNTSFIKRLGGAHGGDWTARISVDAKSANRREEVSLIWYVALDENSEGQIKPSNSGSKLTSIRGQTTGIGAFSLRLFNQSNDHVHESYVSTKHSGLDLLKETVILSLRLSQSKNKSVKRVVLAGDQLHSNGKPVESNFVAIQITGKMPLVLDVVFESGSFGTREETLVGDIYSDALKWNVLRIDQQFEHTFNLKEKGFNSEEINFARSTMSNMLGSIGFFYGNSRVQSVYTQESVPYWKSALYASVPSRSFFPRGFLWDEGFHGYLIGAWDLDIELDIMCHWFDLMNAEGWIPREQILGAEALAKVPSEFVIQKNTNANPPTFFLTLQYILNRHQSHLTGNRLRTLKRMYPRLQAWFSWFNTTQVGDFPGTYRWRGRDSNTIHELNPKTLTSGLDDYPRSSHPSADERHIDLRCWIALAADTMARLSMLLGAASHRYYETAEYLKDNELMDQLHWSDYAQRYADFGLHTDAVELRRPKVNPRVENQNLEKIRIAMKTPEHRLVDSTFGYISLFPFLLHLVDESSPKLGKILDDIENPDLIWTDFGLRSLSKNSPLYMKRNSEHDPPYWRGQIWININFLAVRALDHYSKKEGPYQDKAANIYVKLRSNVINNVILQYYKTGYVWEQYNDTTGEGHGCRPFTGWSALVVMMMAEQY